MNNNNGHVNNLCPICGAALKCRCASFIHEELPLTKDICSFCKEKKMANVKMILEALNMLDKNLSVLAGLRETKISTLVNKLKNTGAIEQYAQILKSGKPETLSSIFGIITSDDGSKTLSNDEIVAALNKGGVTGATPAQKQVISYIKTIRPNNVSEEKLDTAHTVTASGNTSDAWRTLHNYAGSI
jgi:hypothetical protein